MKNSRNSTNSTSSTSPKESKRLNLTRSCISKKVETKTYFLNKNNQDIHFIQNKTDQYISRKIKEGYVLQDNKKDEFILNDQEIIVGISANLDYDNDINNFQFMVSKI